MSDQKMTMEVPPQVRDFAVKSVDQAERAISSFMESASKSVAMVPSSDERRGTTGTCNHREEPEGNL